MNRSKLHKHKAPPHVRRIGVLAGVLLCLAAGYAEARCPRSAAGTYSGLLRSDAFSNDGNPSEVQVNVIRIVLSADGRLQASFDSKSTFERTGESGTAESTYQFNNATCRGTFSIGRYPHAFRLTDSGRVMVGIAMSDGADPADDAEATAFQFFRE